MDINKILKSFDNELNESKLSKAKSCCFCGSTKLTYHKTTPENGGQIYADEDGENYDTLMIVKCDKGHQFYISR